MSKTSHIKSQSIILNERSKIYDSQQYTIKKLNEFISLSQKINLQRAIFFLYPGENCQPQKLLNIYERNEIFKAFDIYISEATFKNDQKCIIIGLNQRYLNFTQNEQQLSFRHLVLLFLLKKLKEIKFVLCLDEYSLDQTDFDNVKKSFKYIASLFNIQYLQQIKQSFIIMVSHYNDTRKNKQKINGFCKDTLLQSLNQAPGFYIDFDFVKGLVETISEKKRIFVVNIQDVSQNINETKDQLKNIINQCEYFNFQTNQQQNPKVSQKFLHQLSQKSKKYANNGDNSSKLIGIKNIFKIWDDFIKCVIQYIITKLKKGQEYIKKSNYAKKLIQSYGNILPQSFQKNNTIVQKDQKSFQCPSFISTNFLSLLYKYYLKTLQQINKISSDKEKEKSQVINSLRRQFLDLLKNARLLNLNEKEDKTIFDYCVSFEELAGSFGNVFQSNKVVAEEESSKTPFFDKSKLMTQALFFRSQIRRRLFQTVQMISIFQLEIQCKKLNQSNIACLENPIKQIQNSIQQIQKMQKNKNQYIVVNGRLMKIIRELKNILRRQKLQMLMGKPLNKIMLEIQYLENYTEILSNKNFLKKQVQKNINSQFFVSMAKTLIKIINETKIADKQYKIHRMAIRLLKYDKLGSIDQIEQLYSKLIHSKILIKRGDLIQGQRLVLREYVEFCIEMGQVQKGRQMAIKVGKIDKKESKSLLCRCLDIKKNIRVHSKFLGSLYQQNETIDEDQVRQMVGILKGIFKEEKGKGEGEVIDI